MLVPQRAAKEAQANCQQTRHLAIAGSGLVQDSKSASRLLETADRFAPPATSEGTVARLDQAARLVECCRVYSPRAADDRHCE
jgi:hypothetical protein